MKLDRNVNANAKGKYALVRLRNIEPESEAFGLLKRLEELGHLDWGIVGQPDEFFVIKLRDKYSAKAIAAYSDAVMADANRPSDPGRFYELSQYAIQVQSMMGRAGILSDFYKEPD